ncbi:sulfate permease [Pseudonocardia sp. CA-107938]|uniref:sulfate permease n=1 Tax=Pseudonocardia sp. CA-107938 TaxID=3240021 RepID=UPI003D917E14
MRASGVLMRVLRGSAPALRPGLRALRRRDRSLLTGDLLAGITVAAYLVPQVLAYAQVAGLPAITGLWASVGALTIYAVLGSSRLLSVGPESTTALLTATAITPLALGDGGRYTVLAAALALLVGGICLLGRIARLGFLADALSKPVLVGYMAGIALVMIAGQLGRTTGVPVTGDTVVAQVGSFAGRLEQAHLPTVALAAGVLALLGATRLVSARLPGPLIAVLAATLATTTLSLDGIGIAVVGDVPVGLPTPGLAAVGVTDLAALLLPALGVAMVGYSDNVLTARAFAARGDHGIDANREMLALGAANIAAGVMHGFPVSSSGSRTVIAESVGGRTQLTSLVTVTVLIVVLLVGGPVLADFPTAALGSLVVAAAARLVEVGEFRRFGRFRRSELALALATTIAVLSLGVLYGVLAAIGLSVLDVLRRVSRPHSAVLGFVAGVAGMHDVDDYPGATTVPGLVVFRYDAPLFFANADDFRARAVSALDSAADPRWLLLNMEAVVEVDVTAADSLTGLCDELDRRGTVLALARTKHEVLEDLARAGLIDRIGTEHVFATLPTAVDAFRAAETATPRPT